MKTNEHDEILESDWLELALRQMPTPETPGGLRDRLIASIPRSTRGASKKLEARSNLRFVSMAMAVSVVAVCLGILWFNRENQPPSKDAIQNALVVSDDENSVTTTEIHFEGETDPCYILGPLFY